MNLSRTLSLAACAALVPAPLFAQYTERADVSTAGAEADGGSQRGKVSADGRFIAFVSDATNLVPGDTNLVADIFVRDLQTGVTTRVSVSSAGDQANSFSNDPAISADGRFVAFTSHATNLVPSDTNFFSDVFVHDRIAGTTERVSVDSSGAQANDRSDVPSISSDGRKIAFHSYATDLVAGDTNTHEDVFVHDRKTGATTMVSVSSLGQQGNGNATVPAISGDGMTVAFRSEASNLVPVDTNAFIDVFVHDLATGVTTLESVASSSAQGNERSSSPSLSFDGRWLAFESRASNLVTGDTNSAQDVFLRDLSLGMTTRIGLGVGGAQPVGVSGRPSISHDGQWVGLWSDAPLVSNDTNGYFDAYVWDVQGDVSRLVSVEHGATSSGDGPSDEPSISHDGRVLAFGSYATDLVPGDTNGEYDLFVRVRENGAVPETETRRVSVTSKGFEADGGSLAPTISADGNVVSFWSWSTDLIPSDPNPVDQLFAHDLDTGTTIRVSQSASGVPANGDCFLSALSADGRYVAFTSEASNLVPGDTNGAWDTFLHDREAGSMTRVTVDSSGTESVGTDQFSMRCAISGNGLYVAFMSDAADLVPFDTNGAVDAFVHDRATGNTTRVSVDSAGNEGNADSERGLGISADGRWVAFQSEASNLVAGDTNGVADIFVRDLLNGVTQRVSVDSLGQEAYAQSFSPAISADGRLVAFVTSTRLTPDDKDFYPDAFVHDRLTGATTLVSISDELPLSALAAEGVSMSPNGRFVSFYSTFGFVQEDTNGQYDVYRRDLLLGRTELVSRGWDGQPGNDDSPGGSVSNGGAVAYVSWSKFAPNEQGFGEDVYVFRECGVTFETFGQGLAGTGGVVPHLTGIHGTCRDYSIRAWNGVGAGLGAVFLGFGESAFPLFGGTLYVDLAQTWFSVPIALGGPVGVPGAGAYDLDLGSLASIRGETLVLQALVLDTGAAQSFSFSSGLRLRVGD